MEVGNWTERTCLVVCFLALIHNHLRDISVKIFGIAHFLKVLLARIWQSGHNQVFQTQATCAFWNVPMYHITWKSLWSRSDFWAHLKVFGTFNSQMKMTCSVCPVDTYVNLSCISSHGSGTYVCLCHCALRLSEVEHGDQAVLSLHRGSSEAAAAASQRGSL